MDTTTKEKTERITKDKKLIEKIRLDKSYVNYQTIIEKDLPYKFSYLDEWLLKQSKLLFKESEKIESLEKNDKLKYKPYKRGTIVKVDFGVGLGSEMSQIHFAIVLNKYDNPKNNILTVIPLTSKKGKFNLNLGKLIISLLMQKLNDDVKELMQLYNNNDTKIIKNELKIKKIHTLLNYYQNNFKISYACPSLITTISKTRILKPINEYDIVGTARCENEIMDIIDNDIIDRITNKKANKKQTENY